MSVNAKNLSYEASEPAFLRRLRGEQANSDSDRHERPLSRPRKHTKNPEEDEDQPTYVMEESQDTLSKAEYNALLNTGDQENVDETDLCSSESKDGSSLESTKEKDKSLVNDPLMKPKSATIGGSNKRRLAKIIDDDDEGKSRSQNVESVQQAKNPKGRKGKKIKLSFDDGEVEA